MWRNILICSFSAAVLLIPAFKLASTADNDWPAFYAGAKLWPAGSSALYSFDATKAITHQKESRVFVRVPIYAVALTPLSWFTPETAFVIWQLAGILALLAAAQLLWQYGPLAVALFSPVGSALREGQDGLFLVAAALLAIALLRSKRYFLAGLILAVCALKFHLLLLLPVFFVARRMWRMAAGMATAGIAMAAGSCAIFGWRCFLDWYNCVKANEPIAAIGHAATFLQQMPNTWMKALFVALLIAAAFAICRYVADTGIALAGTIAVSIFCAPAHFYIYDVVFALPLLVAIGSASESIIPNAASHGAVEIPIS